MEKVIARNDSIITRYLDKMPTKHHQNFNYKFKIKQSYVSLDFYMSQI